MQAVDPVVVWKNLFNFSGFQRLHLSFPLVLLGIIFVKLWRRVRVLVEFV